MAHGATGRQKGEMYFFISLFYFFGGGERDARARHFYMTLALVKTVIGGSLQIRPAGCIDFRLKT